MPALVTPSQVPKQPLARCLLTRCRNSVRSFFLFRHRAAATLFFSRRLFLRSSSSSSCQGKEPLVRLRVLRGQLPSDLAGRTGPSPEQEQEPECAAGEMDTEPACPLPGPWAAGVSGRNLCLPEEQGDLGASKGPALGRPIRPAVSCPVPWALFSRPLSPRHVPMR